MWLMLVQETTLFVIHQVTTQLTLAMATTMCRATQATM